jgi:hypothetical protein
MSGLNGLRKTVANFSYPSSAAAVVFGVHLSARFRLTGIDRKSTVNGKCV